MFEGQPLREGFIRDRQLFTQRSRAVTGSRLDMATVRWNVNLRHLLCVPECVMFNQAALHYTRISFDRASRVRGTSTPDFAIFVLLSPVVPAKSELVDSR